MTTTKNVATKKRATKKIVITRTDRQRLGTLIEKAAIAGLADRHLLYDLEAELERAAAVDPQTIPANVITMNSTARLRDLETGESFEYTLVYPRDANPDHQRVSVLAPVGTAIIGCQTGDVIEWPIPAGTIRLEVEDVIYQPESAGRYDR